jgi:hypothetical protein
MSKSRKKKLLPKCVLALPDLEQSKTAVLNTLKSKSGQRSYNRAITDFVDWYCSKPRLAFNRTVVLRYRIYLEQKQYAATTINLNPAVATAKNWPWPAPVTNCREGSCPQTDDVRRSWKLLAVNANRRLPLIFVWLRFDVSLLKPPIPVCSARNWLPESGE